jgi:hypothetical protein
LVIILGQAEFVLKDSAQLGTLFIIPNRIVQRQCLRVNFVDRNVDMHVVRVVMDDAHPLMFSVAQLLAKTLLDHAQRFGIGVFTGSERNEQMIGPIGFGARVKSRCVAAISRTAHVVSVETQLVIVTSPTLVFLPWRSSK